MKRIFIGKTLVLITLFFFVLTGIIPSINCITIDSANMNKIFEDDFNDNSIDYTKWSEIFSDGIWKEKNQRVELTINEGTSTRNEGIISPVLDVAIDTVHGFEVNCQMITYIDEYDPLHYNGIIGVCITNTDDQVVQIEYRRFVQELHIMDSQHGDIILHNQSESPAQWDVKFEIYSNRYRVTVKGYESDWVYKSIFTNNTKLRIRLHIELNGGWPSYWWIAGFDNLYASTISGTSNPPDTPIIKAPLNEYIGVPVIISAVSSDPDGEQIYYWFEWQDGTNSGWIGPINSGVEIKVSHLWMDKGNFHIMVKAKDIFGYYSDWGSFDINIPNTRSFFNIYWMDLIEKFPFIQKLLNRLILN